MTKMVQMKFKQYTTCFTQALFLDKIENNSLQDQAMEEDDDLLMVDVDDPQEGSSAAKRRKLDEDVVVNNFSD